MNSYTMRMMEMTQQEVMTIRRYRAYIEKIETNTDQADLAQMILADDVDIQDYKKAKMAVEKYDTADHWQTIS